MKILLFVLILIISFNSFSQLQDETTFINHVENFTQRSFNNSPESEDNYLLYRTKNMFEIKEINAEKINQYQKLELIQYKNNSNEVSYLELSAIEFIDAFKNNQINSLLLNIQRDKHIEKWYRLGNTNYVLIGYPENRIAQEFNKKTK